MSPHHDAPDWPAKSLDVSPGPSPLDKLDRARARLVDWRIALEAAGYRTNLSLMPPCSLAARRVDESDERWVTVLPTGLVALERRDLGESAATWSRVTEHDREPTVDDVVRAIRVLFARPHARSGRASSSPPTGPALGLLGGAAPKG